MLLFLTLYFHRISFKKISRVGNQIKVRETNYEFDQKVHSLLFFKLSVLGFNMWRVNKGIVTQELVHSDIMFHRVFFTVK